MKEARRCEDGNWREFEVPEEPVGSGDQGEVPASEEAASAKVETKPRKRPKG
jgi:hypothetical protein